MLDKNYIDDDTGQNDPYLEMPQKSQENRLN